MYVGVRPSDFSHDRRLIELAPVRHQRVVQLEIGLLVLLPGGERNARCDFGIRAEDRPFLVDEADIAVLGEQLRDLWRLALTVGAVIVVELDDRDVAVGIAADRREFVLVELLDERADRFRRAPLFFFRALGFEGLQRLDDDLRVLHEIGADDRLDLLFAEADSRVRRLAVLCVGDRRCEQDRKAERDGDCRAPP